MANVVRHIRHTPTVLMVMVLATRMLLTTQIGYIVHSQSNKRISDPANYYFLGRFQLDPNMTMSHCFERCLENCLCVGFEICGRECGYFKTDENTNLADMLREESGCTFYNFERKITAASSQQCSQGRCVTYINCCLKSNPCQNAGKCLPVYESDPRKRFQCRCAGNGYHGPTCSETPGSCRDYAVGGLAPSPGIYNVYDGNGDVYRVYCDFDSKGAWTLIQSYALSESDHFLPYTEDKKLHDSTPGHWTKFRLRRLRINTLGHSNGKWRITCNYNTNPRHVYASDYVIGKEKNIDILNFHGLGCSQVEEIQILDQHCDQCTAFTEQTDVEDGLFNIQITDDCEFNRSRFPRTDTMDSVKFFGVTDRQTRNVHHCANSSEATTQTWLGF